MQLYNLVLDAQLAGIEVVAPGTPWNHIQETMVSVLTEGLVDLGLLKGTVETLIEEEAYKVFYMHGSGHYLGLDTHDVGSYKTESGQWRELEAGMVITVEPGLYIAPSDTVDEHWWNMGIRIEDDVLVTGNGYRVLSEGLEKTVEAIEGLMVSSSSSSPSSHEPSLLSVNARRGPRPLDE